MKIYLCSRVAADARPLNNFVAQALQEAGYEVFIPHLAPFNNASGATDKEIYEQDMKELQNADAVVAVGRLGIDCSIEMGFAMGSSLPIFHYVPAGTDLGWHPMFYSIHNEFNYDNLDRLLSDLEVVARFNKKRKV